MDVIIPTLMLRIRSEPRSQACLGESIPRMGDLLDVLMLHPLFCFGIFLLGLSLRAVQHARFVRTLFFLFAFFLLGLSFTSFQHARFVCMHLSGVEVYHHIRIIYKDLTRLC